MQKPKTPTRTPDEVAKRIAEWHSKNDTGMEIYEYLGWTETQYKYFLETGKIPDFNLRDINS